MSSSRLPLPTAKNKSVIENPAAVRRRDFFRRCAQNGAESFVHNAEIRTHYLHFLSVCGILKMVYIIIKEVYFMKSQKLISSLLLAAMLTSLAACGGASSGDDTTDSGDTTPSVDTTLSEEDARLATPDNLPGKNYEGYEFRIMHWSDTFLTLEEETGDILDDAEYQRTRTVEERFNVDIVKVKVADFKELNTQFPTSVLAGDNSVDLAIPHQIQSGPTFINSHVVGDWNETGYIDLSQPWWNQRINETIEIQGHQFYIAGPITKPSPWCIFFNKKYIEDYSLEDPYTLVKDGTWTIDVLLEWSKLTSKDLNGDSKYDENDQYGFCFNHDNQTLNFMYAAGMQSVLVDEEGMPVPNVNNEKMIALIEKVIDLRWKDDRTLRVDYNNQGTVGNGAFNEGRLFMKAFGVGDAANLRDSEIDFGIIPYPKWDEEQDAYYTHVDGMNGMLCFPINAEDYERTGIIVEALAAESWKQVTPVYYDQALGEKYFRDETSIEMMDIIMDGILYDFGYIFDQWKNCTWTIVRLVASQSADVASHWASIESSVTEHYNTLYESVLAYEE